MNNANEIDILITHLNNINSYPETYKKVLCEIKGVGFFPGGKGLWNSSETSISDKSIMILGNDFGGQKEFDSSVKNGHENINSLTWRNIEAIFTEYGIPREKCFLTNVIMGVRVNVSATAKSPALHYPLFLNDCKHFLIKQIELQKPKLIIVLGLQILTVISDISDNLSQLKNIKSFKTLDENKLFAIEDCQINTIENYHTNIVIITHPTYRHLNIKHRNNNEYTGAEVEKEILKKYLSQIQY